MDLRQSPVCWERGWRQTQLPRGECWAASLGQGCSGEPVPEPGPGWASCWVTLARDLPPFWVQFPFLSNEAGVGWGSMASVALGCHRARLTCAQASPGGKDVP